MIHANSRVKFDFGVIGRLKKAQIQALEQTGEYLHTEIVNAQVVPFRDGTLQGEAFSVDYSDSGSGRVSLTHSTPYARRLYFHPEYNFNKSTNPNARGKWMDDWVEGSKREDIKKAYAALYKRISGV